MATRFDENEPLRSAAAYVIAATDGSHNTMTYHDHDKCLPWALDMLRAALALKPGAIDDLAPPLDRLRLLRAVAESPVARTTWQDFRQNLDEICGEYAARSSSKVETDG